MLCVRLLYTSLAINFACIQHTCIFVFCPADEDLEYSEPVRIGYICWEINNFTSETWYTMRLGTWRPKTMNDHKKSREINYCKIKPLPAGKRASPWWCPASGPLASKGRHYSAIPLFRVLQLPFLLERIMPLTKIREGQYYAIGVHIVLEYT